MKLQIKPISIPPELAAKCDGPDQLNNFDSLFRAVIVVPKAVIGKEEVKWKESRNTINKRIGSIK